MKGLKMKCEVLVCLHSSAPPLFSFMCVMGWCLVHRFIVVPDLFGLASLTMETSRFVSVSDHLHSPLQGVWAHLAIRQYQTALQSPVNLEFPTSSKPVRNWSLRACAEGSRRHMRSIPAFGCFSPVADYTQEQLAFPASSPPFLCWATSGNQKSFNKK